MTAPADLDVEALTALTEKLIRTGDTRRLKTVRDQLKAAVDRKQAQGRQERWMHDPVGWAQDRLAITPWSKQREIMESIRDHRKTVVRSAHSTGKSFCASMAVSWWLDSHPPGSAFCVTSAPTAAQVRAILWRYIRRMHKENGLPGRVNQTEWLIDEELVAFGRKPADADESSFQGIHCMDTAHEILTRRGWLGIDDITTDDEVLSVPVDGDIAEWMPVTEVHRYDFDGELNVLDSRTVSFAYTDNHRLPVRGQSGGSFSLRPLADIKDVYQYQLRRLSGWKGEPDQVPAPFAALGWDTLRFARFVGFWTGDGGIHPHSTGRFYGVKLYQTKGRGVRYAEELFDGVRTYRGRDFISTSNRALATWLMENVGRYQIERRIPPQILDASPEVLEAYCEGLWMAEGSFLPDGTRRMVYTTSKILADQLQELLVKLGHPATLGINRKAGTLCKLPQGGTAACRETFCLSWVQRPTDFMVFKKNVRREKYAGRVWCISTPHQTFYTRRNGRVSLSGNSPYVLCVLDECGGIPDQLWVGAEAITTGPECRILAIGNPDNAATHFYKVSQPGSGWNAIRISAFDSPNFTGEPVTREAALSLVSREWVEEKEKEWGKDNALFRSKIEGEFTVDSADTVVRSSDVATCRIDPEAKYSPADLSPVELGVDVGGGLDETVIRERRGLLAGREWRIRTDRPEKIAPLVLRALRESRATAVKIDSIGVGFGVIGELRNAASRHEHNARIIGVNVSENPRDKKKFVNKRAEMWWEIGREMSAQGLWDLSQMENADITAAELLQPRWFLDSKGRIQVEPKDDIRKRTGKSPDHADALLLAYFSGAVPRMRFL